MKRPGTRAPQLECTGLSHSAKTCATVQDLSVALEHTTYIPGLSCGGGARGAREPQHRRNMVLLDSDAFLTHFSRILEKSRGTGTVQITMKRCTSAALLKCSAFLPTLSAAVHAARLISELSCVHAVAQMRARRRRRAGTWIQLTAGASSGRSATRRRSRR